jgi:hypothetical protein
MKVAFGYIWTIQFAQRLVTDWSQIPRDQQGWPGSTRDRIHVAPGSRGDFPGRSGNNGDEALKAVNRKVHGSNPCSGAKFEFRPDNDGAVDDEIIAINCSRVSLRSALIWPEHGRVGPSASIQPWCGQAERSGLGQLGVDDSRSGTRRRLRAGDSPHPSQFRR